VNKFKIYLDQKIRRSKPKVFVECWYFKPCGGYALYAIGGYK